MCSEHLVLELRCHKQTFLRLSWQLMTLFDNSIFWPQASTASAMREPYFRTIPSCTALHCYSIQHLHLYLESPFSVVELESLSKILQQIFPCEQKSITISDSQHFFCFLQEIPGNNSTSCFPESSFLKSSTTFFPNTLPHEQDKSKFIILSKSCNLYILKLFDLIRKVGVI